MEPDARFCGACGTAAGPTTGPVAPVAAGGGPRRGGRAWWAVAAAVLVVGALLGGVLGVVVARSGGEGSTVEVVLEPRDHVSDAPFVESSVRDDLDLGHLDGFSTDDGAGRGSDSDVVVGQVSGDLAGLYGATPGGAACDGAGMALRIAEDDDVERTWSEVMGVEAGGSGALIEGLTPVVLGRDTAVTNHTYGPSGAEPYQAVLQAGTPVMVDGHGVPRVQCSCGNPLLPPDADAGEVELVGDPWDDFDARRIAEVTPSEDPLEEIDAIDVVSGDPAPLPVAGPGEGPVGGPGGDVPAADTPDTVELDGLLVADDAGVHVHAEDGERHATVLDQPVERVVDDGAGGIIYTLRRSAPDAETQRWPELTAPTTAAEATVWHLPAGADEPVELIASDDPAARWAVVQTAGTLAGRRVVAYADLSFDEGAAQDAQLAGRLVLRDLETGDERVVEEHGWGWELSTSSVTIGGDRIAYDNGYAYPSWTVRDSDLAAIDSPCTNPDDIDTGCPWRAGLAGADDLAGLVASETGESVWLAVAEVSSGAIRPLDADVGGYLGDWTGETTVDAADGRVVVSFLPGSGSEAFPTVITDVDGGSPTQLALPGMVRFLRAPLLRPADDVEQASDSSGSDPPAPPDAPRPDSPPPPPLDVNNMLLPVGACPEEPVGVAPPPVRIVDGTGEEGIDSELAGRIYVAIADIPPVQLDVDADGALETLVVVHCNWGGSGTAASLVALRHTGGNPELAAEPARFQTGGRFPKTVEVEAETVVIRGDEWTDQDAHCCPSGAFASRWEVSGGAWVEVS